MENKKMENNSYFVNMYSIVATCVTHYTHY